MSYSRNKYRCLVKPNVIVSLDNNIQRQQFQERQGPQPHIYPFNPYGYPYRGYGYPYSPGYGYPYRGYPYAPGYGYPGPIYPCISKKKNQMKNK